MATQAEDSSWNSWCHEGLKICTPSITCFLFRSFCSVTVKVQETNFRNNNTLILCTGIIQMSIMPLNTTVMECPVGCGLSMQYSCHYWGNNRRHITSSSSSSSSLIKPVETCHGYHDIEFFHLSGGIIESFFGKLSGFLMSECFFSVSSAFLFNLRCLCNL